MDRGPGLIAIAAIGGSLGAACGSFGAADESGDGGQKPATATFCSDLKPFTEGFDADGWASGWEAHGSGLRASPAVHESAPNALVLEVAAGSAAAESWMGRPLGFCHLKASAWV